MCFKGCPRPLGCTILLRGASAMELPRLKRITQFLTYAAYRLQLESAFLADELSSAAAAREDLRCRRFSTAMSDSAPANGNPGGQSEDGKTERSSAQAESLSTSSSLCTAENTLAPMVADVTNGSDSPKQQAAPRSIQGKSFIPDPTTSQKTGAPLGEAAVVDPDSSQHLAYTSAATTADTRDTGAIVSVSPHVAVWQAWGDMGQNTARPAPGSNLPNGQSAEDQSSSGVAQPDRSMSLNPDEVETLFHSRAKRRSSDLAQEAQDLALRPAAEELYGRQRLHFSGACRNPCRGLLCEPPEVRSIEYYLTNDVPLAAFLLGPHHLKSVRRVPLSAEASCMSFGHFLELSFSALNLELRGGEEAWPLHSGFVRYFGIGAVVACFHFEHISPNVIQLPAPQISYALEAQQQWLLGEVDELSQEAHEAFNAIECALHEHAASMQRHHNAIAKGASAAEDPTQPMSALLSAVGEERAAFTGVLEEVASIVCRPLAGSYSNLSTLDSPEDTPEGGSQAAPHPQANLNCMASNHLVAALRRLSRLRRSLTVVAKTWSSTLLDPVGHGSVFTQYHAGQASIAGSIAPSAGFASRNASFDLDSMPGSPSKAGSRPASPAASRHVESAFARKPSAALGSEQQRKAPGQSPDVPRSPRQGPPSGKDGTRSSPQTPKPSQPPSRQNSAPAAGQSTGWNYPGSEADNSDVDDASTDAGSDAEQSVVDDHDQDGASARDHGSGQGDAGHLDSASDSDGQMLGPQHQAERSQDGDEDGEGSASGPDTAAPPDDAAEGEEDSDATPLPKLLRKSISEPPSPGERIRPQEAQDLSKQLENDIKHLQLQRELSSASAFISHFDDWQQFVGQHPEKAETATALLKESLSSASHKKPPASAIAARADSLKGQLTAPAALEIPSTASSTPSAPAAPEHSRSSESKVRYDPKDKRKLDFPPGTLPLTYGKVELHGRALLPVGAEEQVVVVRDDEPTSIVAYFLSARMYQDHIRDAQATILYGAAPKSAAGAGPDKSQSKPAINVPSSWVPDNLDEPPTGKGLTGQSRSDVSEAAASTLDGDSSLPSGADQSRSSPGTAEDWRILMSAERCDFTGNVTDEPSAMPWSHARMQVIAYFAPQFEEMRRRCCSGGTAAYLASLSRSRKWDSRGGKSGSYFAKTHDDRYIIKQMSKTEKASFLDAAPAYFRYVMGESRKGGLGTCLSKIVGIYQVSLKAMGSGNQQHMGKDSPWNKDGVMDLLVTENVFYNQAVDRVYDLKGSERSRYASDDPSDAGAVLLDANLRESNLSAPILVEQQAYEQLERVLWADTAFLASMGVMDYSLLVGVDRNNHTLVIGIIDFIRQYTWDKQLETWVKSTGFLGGAGKEPTVISPRQYCRRFRVAMASYFTCVPHSNGPAPQRLSPDLMG
ncbi:hypothetical protein WJX84_010202 [Apatococcus fuscideae]|uniref:PIPK domain-containing protein n=1 Tax=Apatococcus fuscideae TaxID=2026836 RepID=A0AAW1SV91_9CHLO